jgi:bifunctional non-homologous end joining protein LigD
MLSHVKLMHCKLSREPFDRRGCIFEIKWDGFRAIVEISPSEVRLYSRTHRSFTRQFSKVVSSLEKLSRKHEAVFDGQLVALAAEGKSRFEWLSSRSRFHPKLIFYVKINGNVGDRNLALTTRDKR